MKKISIVFSVIFFAYSLFSEETSINEVSEITETTRNNQEKISDCFPQCRSGYFCHEGKCISKCNPPCPGGMECGENGQCHQLNDEAKLKSEKVIGVKKVSRADFVNQGFIITTNIDSSVLNINNNTITFNKKLYLKTETGSYKLSIESPKTFKRIDSEDIENDEVEIIDSPLRKVKLFLGFGVGPGYNEGTLFSTVDLSAGLGIINKHIISANVDFSSQHDDSVDYLPIDSLYSNLRCEKSRYMYGGGLSYGYVLFRKKIVTLFPRISLGYWEHRTTEGIYYNNPDSDKVTLLKGSEKKDTEHYFLKPSFELNVGIRLVRFRSGISTFLGEGVGPASLTLGVVIALL